ncbi:MAG: hypothetical protein ACRD8O_15395 [Bryobacteraceae bacterium]
MPAPLPFYNPFTQPEHLRTLVFELTLTLSAAVQAAEPPVIRAMMAENGAASFGQMIARGQKLVVFGYGLDTSGAIPA